VSRRKFLWGAAAWLSLPPAGVVASFAAGNKSERTSRAAVVRNALLGAEEWVHPETTWIVQTLRNLGFVQKWSTIMEMIQAENPARARGCSDLRARSRRRYSPCHPPGPKDQGSGRRPHSFPFPHERDA